MKKIRLGFLASHGGSNMQSIIDACKSYELNMIPAVVISNNSKSKSLSRAKQENIPNYHISSIKYPNSEDLDMTIKNKLEEHNVDIIILAGYMKKIGPKTLEKFNNRILNIHPALLPQYGGKGMYGINVHKTIINNKETETGVTLHLVDKNYDTGRIINQIKLPVYIEDTPESLQQRVLESEHKFYVDTLKKIEHGNIKIDL